MVHVSVGDTGMVLFSVLLTQPLKKTPLFCLLSGKVFKTIDGILRVENVHFAGKLMGKLNCFVLFCLSSRKAAW